MKAERLKRLQDHLARGGALAKRTPPRAVANASWFHYYAGYPSSFAGAVFRAAQLRSDERVLDPWNGSGTTTDAARDMGLCATGVDINPVANLVSSARLACAADARHLSGLIANIIGDARTSTRTASPLAPSDPLLQWLSPRCGAFTRAFQRRVMQLLATTPEGRELDPLREPLPPLAALLTLALSRAIRTVAPPRTGSNPTWLRPGKNPPVRTAALARSIQAHFSEMSDSLHDMRSVRSSEIEVVQGDARSLPIEDHAISFVLTSPPYLTRVDYVVATTLELALLGTSTEEVAELRRKMMGTPLTRVGERSVPKREWGPEVRQVLESVARHRSPDSFSYYYKTMWQYFDDAYRSLLEMARVLRPGGLAVLVAQNSYYKELELDLPGLLASLARPMGMSLEARVDAPVSRALTSINSRSQAHQRTKNYVEAALLLRREG